MGQHNQAGKIIGILALQGDFHAHRHVLEDRLNTQVVEVRTPRDLQQADALILPGGESTTIAKLLARIDLITPIRERAKAGMPIYGTCAGMILLARDIEGHPEQPTVDLLDITVARNAFGRQVDSFEADLSFDAGGETRDVRGVFIRAPYATRVGHGVEVVATLADKIVGVRQGSILATAFHPELTDDPGVHAAFVEMTVNSRERR